MRQASGRPLARRGSSRSVCPKDLPAALRQAEPAVAAGRMGQKKMAMNGKNRITNDGGRPVRTSVAVESADYAIAVPGKFCASTA
jgi:hypothetical protein